MPEDSAALDALPLDAATSTAVDPMTEAVTRGLWSHVIAVAGFLLAFFLVARLLTEKRQPGNTFAWLLGIVLVPYVGVPLYLLFGGRKLRRLMATKSRLYPSLAGTQPPAPATTALPIVQTLTGAGASPPVGGNSLRLLTTGEATFAALEEQICGARHSIHIATFILGRDATGKRLLRLLAERARAGVKVRLQLDAVGCMFAGRGFVRPLREAGGEVVRFMPVLPLTFRGSANLRNHRKLAIFDQHTAIVGGHNLATEYMGPTPSRKRWRDFGAVISGPAAALLNEVFLADWAYASNQPGDFLHRECDPTAVRPEGHADVQVVASGPDVKGDALYEGVLAMIQEARQRVWIITPYYIPDDVLQRSLIVKSRTGCDVTLVLPARSNHPVTDYARRHFVRELRAAGARILHFGPGMMHAKAVIVDDRAALFGSANLDLRSLFVNFEIGVFTYSLPEVRAIAGWASGLMQDCHEPTSMRPRRLGVLSDIAEDLSRLLAPLL